MTELFRLYTYIISEMFHDCKNVNTLQSSTDMVTDTISLQIQLGPSM